MTYRYNPHCHVKIWLSKNPHSFLNLENQHRIAKMREINPSDRIHFIFDGHLLTSTAVEELIAFCKHYQLIPKDVRELIATCKSVEEKNLVELYKAEVACLQHGGNPAAASDILRWLEPVYSLGTYTDFDIQINTQQLLETIEVNSSILLNIGSIAHSEEDSWSDSDSDDSVLTQKPQPPVETLRRAVYVNNDLLAIVDPKQAQMTIKRIQTAIYQACQKQSSHQSPYIQYINAMKTSLNPKSFNPKIEAPILYCLHQRSIDKTAIELRQKILESTADNQTFCQTFFSPEHRLKGNLITHSAKLIKNYKIPTQSLWIGLEDNEFEIDETQPDPTVVQTFREKNRFHLLKDSVIHTTGAGVLLCTLFPEFIYNTEAFNERIAPYSFEHYHLTAAFHSTNGIPLNGDVSALLRVNAEIEHNDCSWLPEGEAQQKIREAALIERLQFNDRFFKAPDKSTPQAAEAQRANASAAGTY